MICQEGNRISSCNLVTIYLPFYQSDCCASWPERTASAPWWRARESPRIDGQCSCQNQCCACIRTISISVGPLRYLEEFAVEMWIDDSLGWTMECLWLWILHPGWYHTNSKKNCLLYTPHSVSRWLPPIEEHGRRMPLSFLLRGKHENLFIHHRSNAIYLVSLDWWCSRTIGSFHSSKASCNSTLHGIVVWERNIGRTRPMPTWLIYVWAQVFQAFLDTTWPVEWSNWVCVDRSNCSFEIGTMMKMGKMPQID